jgi:signal transduction histidine kinase
MVELSSEQHLKSSALLPEFLVYESKIAIMNARRAAVFAGLFMFAGWGLDLIVFPTKIWDFLLIRAICVMALLAIFFYLYPAKLLRGGLKVAQGIALLPMISICIMIALTDGGNSIYYAGLNLVLAGLSLIQRWSFFNSLLMIFAFLGGYAISIWLSPVISDQRILVNNCYLLFTTSVFVLGASYYYGKLRFSEFCLRTELQESQGLLEVQNRQLNELDDAKTRFFSNISHELRTPLTIMLGITERLRVLSQDPKADTVVSEMTLMLEQNGLRLLKLINDLLDLVRFDSGRVDFNRLPTAIEAHLETLLPSLRHLADQDGVSLTWACESYTPTILLDCDKFDKIILNLVINAIKFTPSGGKISVLVMVSGKQLRLTVEDTGVGIAPEVLPQVFERFWQVDNSATRKFQGAGIGLSLVRSLTEVMEGKVKVISTLGVGTTFTVVLPTNMADLPVWVEGEGPEDPLQTGGNIAELHRRAAFSNPSKIQSHSNQATAPTSNTGRPLVLIADDEPDIRRFLRLQLQQHDVDVIEASNGTQALELAFSRSPQLALLDHMMPEMDGVEVCKHIRENYSTRGISIIILTARADEQTKLDALKAGANDFLTKPFSIAELSLRLENQIAMARIRHEMVDLNTELNYALEQIKENEVLMVRNEKLSSLGRMSAGIIHEINNPLNYANAGLHALQTFTALMPAADQPDFTDILKDIRDGVERVSQIVIDLRKFTRDDTTTSGDADLVEIIIRSRRMISHQVGPDIAFNFSAPDQAIINGNSNQLVQVFINFFQNSMDAIRTRITEHGGDPGRVDCSISPLGEGWQVTVSDNGIGIRNEDREKIFDPFYTSKEVGQGMGLGLSITHQILQAHQAKIVVDSRPLEYTRFCIAFPPQSFSQVSADSVLDPNDSSHQPAQTI